MELKKSNFEDIIKKEWIITNGLGGFASSTVAGANTRRYHGILVAPLNPPAQRYLLVSKVDESIDINGKTYPLYTNMCKNNISEGYKNLVAFEKEEVPKAVIRAIGREKGLDVSEITSVDFAQFKETQYDLLAAGLREHLDMKKIYEILEEGI